MERTVVRTTLAIAGLALLALCIWRGVAQIETTTTTATTTATTTSPAAPAASTAPGSTTVTRTSSTGSDALVLGLFGTGVLVGLMAVFYDRISQVTLPGGLGLQLSAADQAKAASAVSERIAERVPAPQQEPAEPGVARGLYFLSQPRGDPQAQQTAIRSAQQAGEATVIAARYAQDLLRVSRSTSLLRSRAGDLGIVDDHDIAALGRGQVPDSVWRSLADRALADVGVVT